MYFSIRIMDSCYNVAVLYSKTCIMFSQASMSLCKNKNVTMGVALYLVCNCPDYAYGKNTKQSALKAQ